MRLLRIGGKIYKLSVDERSTYLTKYLCTIAVLYSVISWKYNQTLHSNSSYMLQPSTIATSNTLGVY